MNRRSLFQAAAALALAAIIGTGAKAQTDSNPVIYNPVLLGSTYSAATNNSWVPMQAKPSGGTSTVQYLNLAGHDFSRTGIVGGRYFLTTERVIRSADTLAAYDETGTQRVVLSDPAACLVFWRANWSHDGLRVAWCGGRYDASDPDTIVEEGIYVADVLPDGMGNPAALANVRQVAGGQRVMVNPAHVSWTSDQRYIVFMMEENSVYSVHRVSANVPTPVSSQKINIGNASSRLFTPKASPLPGDNRISFVVDGTREIWTVSVPAAYNPATDVLAAKQVTKNAAVYGPFTIMNYDWSPDATQFVFTSNSPNYPRVSKVSSAGGKASVTLSSSSAGYSVRMWRN